MVLGIVAPILVLICLAVIAYLLFFSKPISFERTQEDFEIKLQVKANRDIDKMTLSADDLSFVRKNVKAGDVIEFNYPVSEAKLIIMRNGDEKEFIV